MNTPSLTPTHTRLLEHTPRCTRFRALECKRKPSWPLPLCVSTGGQCHHGEVLPHAQQSPCMSPCFWQRLLNVSSRVQETTISDDCDLRIASCKMTLTMITIEKFTGTNSAQWATEMALVLEQKQVHGNNIGAMTSRKSQLQTGPPHGSPLRKTGWIAMVLPDQRSCRALSQGWMRNIRSSTMRRHFGKT